MNSRKLLGRLCAVLLFAGTWLFQTGCSSTPTAEATDPAPVAGTEAEGTNGPPATTADITFSRIAIGDSLIFVFSDAVGAPPALEERVKEDGTVTLMENQTFVSAGKTIGDLEKEVRERYVPKYYVRLTVNIKPQERCFYIGGEVKSPGRQAYQPKITVLRAIQSAGDFTDFAKRTKVELYRGDDLYIIDCVKARKVPSLDMEVLPNDSIRVPRKML